MIGRIIVVSPEDNEDLLIFQVPLNSAAHRLLISMLEETGREYAVLQPTPPKRRKRNTLANPCEACPGGCMVPDGSFMCQIQAINRKGIK